MSLQSERAATLPPWALNLILVLTGLTVGGGAGTTLARKDDGQEIKALTVTLEQVSGELTGKIDVLSTEVRANAKADAKVGEKRDEQLRDHEQRLRSLEGR